MARSNRSRAAMRTDNGNAACQPKSRCVANNIELTQEAIDRHWSALPAQAKDFILSTNDGMFSLSKLVKFWTAPANVQSTRGGIAGSICGATWYLALVYLRLNMHKEARALTINGSFIHQCYNSSIEYIVSVCNSGEVISERQLPYFVRGCSTIRSPDSIKAYIETYLPKEYTQMMTSFANLSSKKNVMGYIDQISDDWKGTSSSSKNGHRSSPSSNVGTQIKLVLVDDTDENERHSFDIGSSTTLKSLFNDYADKRGISLRSLRFSYAGSMLFLSSAGHKSPEQFGMKDQDVIMVHDTSKTQESSDDDSSKSSQSQRSKSSSKKAKAKRSKKAKGKNKKTQKQEVCTKSLEEYKVDHSKQLTKIHEEADAQFKQIRQRLNNLAIERSQRKVKSKRPRSPKPEPALPTIVNNPSKEGLGGKAGKSHYAIQVGEIQNLYKTTKPSAMAGTSLPSLATLDLHGCSREEAVTKLDESLKIWVDSAMQGSYPFVQPAMIVCGCGNQILSETVQDWIKSTDNVSNAPKVRSPRRKMIGSRAA